MSEDLLDHDMNRGQAPRGISIIAETISNQILDSMQCKLKNRGGARQDLGQGRFRSQLPEVTRHPHYQFVLLLQSSRCAQSS